MLSSLGLLCVLASAASSAAQSAIFHGTTVVIIANPDSAYVANSTFLTSNFFSYSTPTGYLSFGWWLPANASTNHQGCKAGSHSYHWIETGKGTCTLQGNCRFWVKNIATNEPDDVAPPNFPEDGADYIVQGLDIGNGPYGRMALSYVDGEEQGGYGVGTRQMLSFDPELYGECTTAFDTLSRVAAKHRPEIEFDLVNPCTKAQKGGLARIGGYALGILTKQLVLY